VNVSDWSVVSTVGLDVAAVVGHVQSILDAVKLA